MNKITVVGLGPAGPDLLTDSVRQLLTGDLPVYLRTREHPAASVAPNAVTFDDVYNAAETIESVYEEIVERLIVASAVTDIVYAVPGSPLIAESTVEKLRADSRVEVVITPALSFLDLVWTALGIDPLAHSPRLVDGRRFAIEAAGERGPLLVAQCDQDWVLSDIKLAYEFETPEEVVVLQRLGMPDQVVKTIAWEDLDREVEPDFLTSLWIPKVTTPVAAELVRMEEMSRRLRKDCPWDQEQTHQTLSKYLIEESYELLEAIDNNSEDDEHLIEELGDVLYQVFAHSAIAAEEGRFNIADVAQNVSDKLIGRHPHVYGELKAATADEVAETWEENKMKEKGRQSVMEGIPSALPALLYAAKVLKRAKRAGYQMEEKDFGTGLGAALLMIVDQAPDGDAEEELRATANAFKSRFTEWESAQS